MKKILFFLMLTLLCIPWATHAQNDQFTLFEYETGNNANWACPVWGYNLNYGTCATEFIIPSEYLDFLEGATFTKMRFYINECYFPDYAASVNWNVPYRVYLSETEATKFSSVTDTIGRANATLVFSGNLNGDKVNKIMDVVFDTPYQYNGGNLVVGFWQNGSSSLYAGNGGCSFITASVADTAYWVGYIEDWSGYVCNDCSYCNNCEPLFEFSRGTMIPKITFDYYGLPCPKPRDLQVYYNPGSTSAQISWISDASDFEIDVNGVVVNFNDASPNSEHFYNIDIVPGTEYTVKVKAHCNGQEESGWSLPLAFITAPQCEVTLELSSNSIYGWEDDSIEVWDNTNSQSLGFFKHRGTNPWELEKETYTVPVSEGQDITFLLANGYLHYSQQCSWIIIAPTGDTIAKKDHQEDFTGWEIASYNVSCSACYITVELNNPGGNDWDGNAIGVSDNAEFLTSITPDENEPIRVLSGHVIDFYWMYGNSGSTYSPSEPYSWIIRDGSGNIITQGSNDNNLQDGEWLASYTADCSSQAPVVPSSCDITIELTDSYGDGWNGNHLIVKDVQADTTIVELIFNYGSTLTNILTVSNGQKISFVYDASGSDQYENGYVITAADGSTIASHTGGDSNNPPTAGPIATYTVNCGSNPTPANYCQPAPTSVDGEGIVNVSFGTGNNIVNNSTYPTSAPYYGDYSSQIGAVAAGTTATVDITFNTCYNGQSGQTCYNYGTLIWVDWNNSGTFGDNEIVFADQSSPYDNPTDVHTLNATFAISANQATGDYRMRIGAADSYFDEYIEYGQGPHDPCNSEDYVVFHDYTLRVTEAPSCLAPVVTVDSWTSTTVNISWTDNNNSTSSYIIKMGNEVLSGSTTPAVSINGTTATLTGLTSEHYYLPGDFTVTANCDGNDFSAAANVPGFYTGYCQPAPASVDGSGITNVSFGTGNNIVNNSSYPTSAPYYGNYTSQIGAVAVGQTATVDITYNTCYNSQSGQSCYNYGTLIWVDWNNNQSFEDNEIVFAGLSSQESHPAGEHTLNATFAVSPNRATGDYRMRIGAADSYFNEYITYGSGPHSPCYSESYAVFHDYTLRVIDVPSCPPVTNLTASNITANTVQLSWNRGEGGHETQWGIERSLNGVLENEQTVSDTNITIFGLQPETNYSFRVQAHCDNTYSSIYSDFVNVTTLPTPDACYTVANSTTNATSSSYSPLYGNYCDHQQRTQSIYPASMLTELLGKTITHMKYYVVASQNYNWRDKVFTVKLATVNEESIDTSLVYVDNYTTVYTGTLYAAMSTGMEIIFNGTVPFTYQGGNLLVEFESTSEHDNRQECWFAGIDREHGSICEYGYSNYPYRTIVINDFLPKVDFCTEPSLCPAVTDLAVSDITTNSAHVSWMPGSSETQWNYICSETELPNQALQNYNWRTAYDLYVDLSNLNANTTYHIYVRPEIMGNNHCADEIQHTSFTTIATCLPPTNVAISNITSSTATVSWEYVNGFVPESGWIMHLSTTPQFGNNDIYRAIAGGNDMESPFTIRELQAGTTYYLKMQSNCRTPQLEDFSIWTEEISFTTLCDAIVVDAEHSFTENFDTTAFPPTNCWDRINANTHAWSRVGASAYNHSGAVNGSAYSSFWGDIYLIMPDIALANDTNDVNLTFWSYNTEPLSYIRNNNSVVLLDGNSETLLWSPSFVRGEWAETTINLNQYKGQTIRLAFKHTGDDVNGWYVDDITVAETIPIACPAVTNLQVIDIESDDAQITWTSNGNEEYWDLYWTTSPEAPTAETTPTVGNTSNPRPWLIPLTPNTHYYAYVRAHCSDADRSQWSSAVEFTTESAPVTCPAVTNLQVIGMDPDAAQITWTSNGNEEYWDLYWTTSDVAPTAQTNPTVGNTNNPRPWLAGLTPGTHYYAYVRARCSDSDRSVWSAPLEFTIPCPVVTNFPWTENFDSYVYTKIYNELPVCWSYINTSTHSPVFPAVCKWSEFAHSGNNQMRFDSYITSDPQDEYAILPRMQNINNLRIQLDARKHSDNIGGTVFVGVMTDPADASTFTTIGSLTPDSTIYEHYTFSFSDYTGSGEYIALMMRAANQVESSIAVCIDDIIVEEIPIEPHRITISQVTGGTIFVDVVDNIGNAFSTTTDTIAAYNAWINLSVEPDAGYTFDNYVVSTASGIPIEIINSGFVMPAEDINVSATFTLNTYTVTATVDPENAGSVTGTGTYNYNAVVTLTATPATGYSFDHWQNMNIADNVDSETANPLSFNVTEDVTYKAFFSMIDYELVYMDGEEVFENVTYNYGDTIDPMSAPEKEGYTFIGWNPAEPVTMPAHNDTLYAQWQLNPCLAPENLAVANGSLTTTSALITWSSNQNNTFGGVYYENGVLAGTNNQLYQRWYLSELQPNTNYRVGVFAYCSLNRVSDTVWVEFTTNDTCYPPVSVSISDVTAHSALLSYNFGEHVPNDFMVHISTDPDFAEYDGTSTSTDYRPNSMPLSSLVGLNLQSGTTYYVRMASQCHPGLTSVWSETLSFTTLQEYAVSVDADITNGTISADVTVATAGTVVNLTATPDNGYSFGEWLVTTVNTPAPEIVTVTNNSFVMPASEVNISATFTPNSYNITLNPGTGGTIVVSIDGMPGIALSTTANYNSMVDIVAVPHVGYSVGGFVVTNADGSVIPTPDDSFIMPANDVTITGNFIINSYTVTATVDPANAGTVTGTGSYNYGSQVEMRAEAADGYLFTNWTNTQGVVVSTDAIFDFEIANDTAFTAHFTAMGVVATPTFSPAEGTYYDAVNVELECATSGATIHYTTDGSTPTASSAIYNGPISLTATSTTTIKAIAMMENMTNSAMASATYTVLPTYTVTIADNIVNGTVRANVTRAAEGVTVNLTAIANEGYHFAAWNVTTETGAVEVSANNSFAMPAGNVTISATFEANEHIITYMDGNTVLDVDTFAYGATITPIADPTREGYTFIGWNPALPTTMPDNDVRATAQWSVNRYALTYMDGNVILSQDSVDYGAPITPIANPTKEGYTFTGWNPQLPQTMPANDVTVNALWELIPCLAAENLAVVNGSLTTTSALITWSSNQDNTFGGVYYENGVLAGSNNQLYQRWNLSELQPGTNYRVGVFAYCSLDRVSDTVWVEFTTNDTCYPPVSVSISDVTAHSALLSYDFGEHVPSDFMVHISTDPDFADYDGTSTSTDYYPNSLTIGGPGIDIQSGTTYYVRMASQCYPGLVSVWSETLSFTTLQEYAVSVDADITNGTVSADATVATAGTVVNLTATPDNGYSFGEWIVTTVNTPAPEIVTVTNNSFVMPASEVNISATFTPNSYNITLNPGTGGTIVVSIDGMPGVALSTTADYNSVVDIVAVPHVGYSVGGFVVTNADGSVIPTPNDSFIMPANDVTITGSFIPNEHIITYMDDNTVLDVDTFTYGATITPIADPTREGYTFIGWNPALPTTMPDNDVRATAQWSINRYALTYMDGNVILAQDSVDYGAPITPIADPTKEGYTFTGWNPQLPQTMPANDVTVNALWELIPCLAAENLAVVNGSLTTTSALITWSSNQDNTFGGVYYENGVLAGSNNQLYQRWNLSELQPGTNYRVGVFAYCSLDRVSDTVWVEFTTNDTCYPPVSVSISDVTAHSALLSYDFGEHVPSDFMVHISTDPDFADYDGTSTSTDYYPNSLTIGGPGIDIQSGTTYYVRMASQCYPGLVSVWSETLSFTTLQEYAVSVDADITNGTISADVTVATAGTVVNLTATPDNGYSFGEWVVTTVNTPAPDTITVTNNSFVMPASEVNISATFTPNSYNITLNPGTGGTIVISINDSPGIPLSTTAEYNSVIDIIAVPHVGYSVGGFVVTNADGSVIPTPNDSFIMPANDVTITGTFIPNEHIITYMDDNTVLDVDTFTYGATITPIADPTREGYTFMGWFPELPATMPDNDVRATAQWSINRYALTYMDGNEILSQDSVDYGTPITPIADPTKEGYTFTGWNPQLPQTMPANDVTVNALWELIPCMAAENLAVVNGSLTTTSALITWSSSQDNTFGGVYYENGVLAGSNNQLYQRWNLSELQPGTNYRVGVFAYCSLDRVSDTVWVEFTTNDTCYPPVSVSISDVTAHSALLSYDFGEHVPSDFMVLISTDPDFDEYDAVSTSTAPNYFPSSMPFSSLVGLNLQSGTTYYVKMASQCSTYLISVWSETLSFTTLQEYAVTIDANIINGTVTADDTVATAGTIVNLTATPDNGYSFGEWIVTTVNTPAPEIVTVTNNSFVMPASEVNISATFTPNSYNITLNPGTGGTIVISINDSPGIPLSTTAEYNSVIDIIAVPHVGYSVGGFVVTNADGSVIPTPNDSFIMPANDVTITGNFIPNEYTITYMDGNTVLAVDTFTYRATVTPIADPTKEGYTFTGWNPELPTTMPDSNLTVDAQWQINSYNITLNPGTGGTIVISINDSPGIPLSTTAEYNSVIDIIAVPHVGYSVGGFVVTNADGSVIPTTDDSFIMPANDVTITGTFIPNEYTITYMDGNTVLAVDTFTYRATVTPIADPTKEGYTFTGWNPELPTTMPDSNLTVDAQWQINSYNITLNPGIGGTIVISINDSPGIPLSTTAEYNSVIDIVAVPHVGYSVGGFVVTNADGTVIPTTDDSFIMPANDVTITGTFIPNEYTITYMDGNTVLDVDTFTYGATITPIDNPTKEGYTFTGWNPELPTTMPDSSLTVDAQWQINSYNITLNPGTGGTIVISINDSPGIPLSTTADYNSVIDIVAVPHVGYSVGGFVVTNADGTVIPTPDDSFIMPANDVTITGNFILNEYTITYMDGNTVLDVDTFTYGATITPTDNPTKEGYTFTGWNPALPTTMPDSSLTVDAQWQINSYDITINQVTGGTITVSFAGESATSAISTTTDTSANFETWIQLSADADYAYDFVDFVVTTASGDTLETPNNGFIMPAENVTVTAIFTLHYFNITVNVSDNTPWGTVTGSGSFVYGSTDTLTATPMDEHHIFVGWSDFNTENPRVITVTQDSTITAYFVPEDIEIISNDTLMGGVNVNITGGGHLTPNTPIVITATPAPHYHFVSWSDGNTDNPRTILPIQAIGLTAIFAIDQHTITVLSNDDNMGTVDGSTTVDYGTVIQISATAYTGYEFVSWNDGNTENPRYITVECDSTFIANFQLVDGIEDANLSNVNVYSYNNQVIIANAEGFSVEIFDMSGRLIVSENSISQSVCRYTISTDGIYLVKVGNNMFKKVKIAR